MMNNIKEECDIAISAHATTNNSLTSEPVGDCLVEDCGVVDLMDKQHCLNGKVSSSGNQKSTQHTNGGRSSLTIAAMDHSSPKSPSTPTKSSPVAPLKSTNSTTTNNNNNNNSSSTGNNSNSNNNSNNSSNSSNSNSSSNKQNGSNSKNNYISNNNNLRSSSNSFDISEQLPAEYSPSKVHILVVDDDIVQRSLLQNMLTKFNFNVTLVTNGEEAWDTLMNGKVKYDLVLTDVMMPMVTGFDLLQRINEHIEIKHIPVILMSGTAVDYKYANDTIKIGGQDFLTKPIAKELLKKKIDTVLTSIWQKKKEAEYKSFLALQKKQMEAKEHEIEELTRKISEMAAISREAMESPLVSVTRTIEELMQKTNWSDQENDIKSKLTLILKELGSSNIYRPSFEKLIKNDSVDPVTKSFLVTEFSSVTGGRRNSIPTFPQTVSSKDTKEGIKGWNFDVFRYSEDDLMPMLVDMFENFQLLETFKIPIEKLQRFIMAVHSLYRKSNRYHNFLHAFDVTQTCYTFLTTFKAAQYLTHLDILSLLIAAMCHDLNHPGFNNTFQVNAQTDLTLQYNDISVLENHHATLTFKILKNSDCNILEGLNEDQYKELRRSVIQLILATDMAFHFEYINKFQHHLNNQPFDRNKKEDRQMILNFLIKCGDISNVARPWHLNLEWSNRVSDEFFQQSQFEKVCGYPVTPFMDKTKTNRPRIAADFIDYVALPLFQGLARFLSDTKTLMEIMTTNRQKWQIELLRLEGRSEEDEEHEKLNNSEKSTNNNSSTESPSSQSTNSSSSSVKVLPKIDEEN